MVFATVHMLILNEAKYIDGACISAYTYRKFGNPDIKHVVMIDKTIKDIKKLERFFDKIVVVDPVYIKSSFELSSAERVQKYASWIDYANTKWYCLMLKEYKKVLLVDDLIATGGTAEAATKLISSVGGEVLECCFVIDLPDLGGAKRLEKAGHKVFSLCGSESSPSV
jgi:predicted phosphoribosyltransferase